MQCLVINTGDWTRLLVKLFCGFVIPDYLYSGLYHKVITAIATATVIYWFGIIAKM